MGKRAAVLVWVLLSFLLLVSCFTGQKGNVSPAAMDIDGIEWFLTEVGGMPVSPLAGERRPFLKFDGAKKEVTGYAGCNNFFGGYDLDGSALKFGPLASTRMVCPDLQMGLETEFLEVLDKTRAWKTGDGVLFLLHGSEVLARLTAESPAKKVAALTGTVWQWVQTRYNDDRTVVPGDSKNYTVEFREDGTLSVKADCNQKGGTYSAYAEDRRLSIEITHSTMAACPSDSLEDEFVRGLTAVTIYFIKDGDLYIDLKYDSGTMRFSEQEKMTGPEPLTPTG